MHYITLGMSSILLAIGLQNGMALGVEGAVEAGVSLGGNDLNIGYFHDQLAPHGKWLEVESHGKVWQPAVALTDENWRPYVNEGHWRMTDAGWYWDSSYDWGWAPFHYGRWNYDDRNRWTWLPDVVWAPAWVSWRHSDTVYGWAPLPFGSRFEGGVFVGTSIDLRADLFSFVPATGFLSVNLGNGVVARPQVGTLYGQTKIVNNTYVYNNNRIVNNGIPVAQVARATKQEIKPVAIADAKSPADKGAKEGKIQAYRPAIKNQTPKNGAAQAKADGTTPAETPIPAKYGTKDQKSDSKAKAPDAKTDKKLNEGRNAGEGNEGKLDGKGPKTGEKAPEAKTDEKADKARNEEKGTQGKNDEKGNHGRNDEKGTQGKNDEKSNQGRNDEKANQGRNDVKGNQGRNDEKGNQGRNDEKANQGRNDEKANQGRNDARGNQGPADETKGRKDTEDKGGL